MIDLTEIEWAISQLENGNSSFPAYAKLADLYAIRDHMKGAARSTEVAQSFATSPPERVENLIEYKSNTEFSGVVYGRPPSEVWPVVDELMEVLRVTNPRLYDGVMRRLQ